MEFDPVTWIVISLAVVISGVSKGGFGAGVGFLATPLMALMISPVQAAAVMLPILILMDQIGMTAYWRRWRWQSVWPPMAAALVGIGIGGLAFGEINPDLFRLGLGLIAILFTLFLLARQSGWAPNTVAPRGVRASIWGAVSGLTSTVSHAGGPPITIYLLGERLDKTEYQAASVLIFWWINLVKLIPYAALGVLSVPSLTTSAMLTPAALAGVALGVWLHKRVSQTAFFRLMIGLLLITSIKLIWDGMAAL
ncbi:MAG: sulfite exporter TauE/SafE family protein [Pseudomonadota bacterium]